MIRRFLVVLILLTSAFPIFSVAQVNLTLGLKLHLPFDGNTLDVSGNGNHATNSGAVLTTDQFGNANSAYQFDGSDDYMHISNSVSLTLNSFSIAVKIKPLSFYNGKCYNNDIISKGEGAGNSPGDIGLTYTPTLNQNTTNYCTIPDPTHENYRIIAGINGAFNSLTCITPANAVPYIFANNWDCVVGTYDAATKVASIYVNGIFRYSYTNTLPLGSNTSDWFIGKLNYVGFEYWMHAILDDVRIYDRVINSSEIRALCDACTLGSVSTNIIATSDTTICQVLPLQIQTNLTLNDSFFWSPSVGLSDPLLSNPIATPAATTTYVVQKKAYGCNAVINADFEDGNTGFGSAYAYLPPSSGANTMQAEYTVWTSPYPWNLYCGPCADHTTGTGKMLIVNGADVLGLPVWQQTIAVAPNTTYKFSTWLSSWSAAAPAILQFSVNGVNLGAPFTASSTTCLWQNFFQTWNSGSATTATISIVNQNTVYGGNDFALDDFFFGLVGNISDSITITVLPTLSVSAGIDTSVDACTKPTISLNGNVSGTSTYKWVPAAGLSSANILTPICSASASTTYTLIATNEVGCTAVDSVTVQVANDNGASLFTVPNVFTPNNDGVNDCCKVVASTILTDFVLKIYNRFGELVFESTNPEQCWYGEVKGKENSDLATYFYWLKCKTQCGEVSKKGDILLMH
jgi:gliding motility-associated-like protein